MKEILDCWFPQSDYEYDSARDEFEYYDQRLIEDCAYVSISFYLHLLFPLNRRR